MDVPAAPDAATPSSKRKHFPRGRDELNLATIPLSVLTHQQPTDTERNQKHFSRSFAYTVYDDQIDQWVPAKVTLKTNPIDGLPTPADESLFLALFNLALESDLQPGQQLEFVPNQLFKMMGLKSSNKRTYDRLEKQLARLAAVKVTCEYSWFDVAERSYQTLHVFGLLSEAKLHRPKNQSARRHLSKQPKSYIVFDQAIYRQLTSGTLKPLDLDFYFSLKLPTSRRMYRSLDRFFYRRTNYSSDLRNFAHGNIGMSVEYNTAQLKRRIQPAIGELVLRNFIQPADEARRYTKIKPGVWRINFDKTPKAQSKRKQVTTKKSSTTPLEQQLIDVGVSRSVVAQLVFNPDYTPEDIQLQIDCLSLRIRESKTKVKNPAGLLLSSIQEQWPPPNGYQTPEQQQKIKEGRATKAKAAQQEATNHEQEKQQRLTFVATWQPVWDKLDSQEQDDIRQAVAGDNPFLLKQERRSKQGTLASLQELARRHST